MEEKENIQENDEMYNKKSEEIVGFQNQGTGQRIDIKNKQH